MATGGGDVRMSTPLKVAVSGFEGDLRMLARQSPGGSLRWGDVQFVADDHAGPVDAWVVYGSIGRKVTLRCPPDDVHFISGEPTTVRPEYDGRFLDQFSLLIGAREFTGRRSIRCQPMLPWHFGWDRRTGRVSHTYDSLKMLRPSDVPKTMELSTVTSGKAFTKGHRERVELIEYLRSKIPPTVFECRGRDSSPVDDKAEVILPARFHLAIENSRFDDYWTEKFTDPILGWSTPVYFGAPNMDHYVPPESFIDLRSLDGPECLERIEQAMARGTGPEHLDALHEARTRVLDQFNFLPAMARIVVENRSGGRVSSVRIVPERRRLVRAVIRRLARGVVGNETVAPAGSGMG